MNSCTSLSFKGETTGSKKALETQIINKLNILNLYVQNISQAISVIESSINNINVVYKNNLEEWKL